MNGSFRGWFAAGALFTALGVASGAFGAHLLQHRLSAHEFEVFEKAVLFHLLHGLGISGVAIAGFTELLPPQAAKRSCVLLAAGICFFSGALYLIALTGVRSLGMLAPVGGFCFLAGWAIAATGALGEHRTANGVSDTPISGR